MTRSDDKATLTRRDLLRAFGSAGIAASGILLATDDARADSWPTSLLPGDILVGRQKDSPFYGYWAHAALYVGSNEIVEGGVASNKARALVVGQVQKVSLQTFKNRYPNIYVFRLKKDATAKGAKMASAARVLVGKGKMNCAQLVRVCYTDAHGKDPMWLSPDYIAASSLLKWIGYKG